MTSDELIKKIAAVAIGSGVKVYAVGGYVRDRIMGRDVKDIDFVVIGSGIGFAKEADSKLKAKDYIEFEKFDTARMRIDDFIIEFAGARSEIYDESSRKPRVSGVSELEADLSRRDFTVNAIAMQIGAKGKSDYIDPFSGIQDIENKILRTPAHPDVTFSDDPLRMIRGARFAAELGFNIAEDALMAISKNAKRIEIVSWERIKDELDKILLTETPSLGLWVLYNTGLLEYILPELTALYGVEFVGDKGHKNQLTHTFKVTDRAAHMTHKLGVRWAALMHDIGKAPTKRFDKKIGWTFHGHDVVGARMFQKTAKRLRFDRDTAKFISKMIRWHLRPIALCDEGITDSAVRRLIVNMGQELDDLIILYRADLTTKNPSKIKLREENYAFLMKRIEEVRETDRLRAFQSPVRGDEIMKMLGVKPGPTVGKYKKAIEEAIIEGIIPNEYAAAKEYLLKIKNAV